MAETRIAALTVVEDLDVLTNGGINLRPLRPVGFPGGGVRSARWDSHLVKCKYSKDVPRTFPCYKFGFDPHF